MRTDLRLALALGLVAAAFRFPLLGFPAEEYFDEVYHAKTAREYLEGLPPTEWVHPPTAKLLLAGGVWAFGYEPWAWRLGAALAGTLLAPVFFLLAREVLGARRAALLASGLLLVDGVYLVQSRIAMTNVFAVLFQVAAALALLRVARRDELSVGGTAALGLLLGLALSTRWTSLWAAAFLGGALVACRRSRLLRPRELALAALAFVVMPAAVYLLSYVPWMRQGHDVGDVLRLQVEIWRYHADLDATHHYYSPWWTWPWLYRPTWYFYDATAGWVRGIVALGNPALWWAAVPATLWALVTAARERNRRLLFCAAGFCCLYLPWGISPRTLNFSHYLFEALPYACLSLGALLDRGWNRPGRVAVRAYTAAALALFLLFLPVLVALPIPAAWWAYRFPGGGGIWTWFASWI